MVSQSSEDIAKEIISSLLLPEWSAFCTLPYLILLTHGLPHPHPHFLHLWNFLSPHRLSPVQVPPNCTTHSRGKNRPEGYCQELRSFPLHNTVFSYVPMWMGHSQTGWHPYQESADTALSSLVTRCHLICCHMCLILLNLDPLVWFWF